MEQPQTSGAAEADDVLFPVPAIIPGAAVVASSDRFGDFFPTQSSRCSPPWPADALALCKPTAGQIRQLANAWVVLNQLSQRHNHRITCANLLCPCVKLPRAVLIIVGNMQNGLPKPHDLCRGEDRDVLRLCEWPCAWGFHETSQVGEHLTTPALCGMCSEFITVTPDDIRCEQTSRSEDCKSEETLLKIHDSRSALHFAVFRPG